MKHWLHLSIYRGFFFPRCFPVYQQEFYDSPRFWHPHLLWHLMEAADLKTRLYYAVYLNRKPVSKIILYKNARSVCTSKIFFNFHFSRVSLERNR